jgi:hypothetical protein
LNFHDDNLRVVESNFGDVGITNQNRHLAAKIQACLVFQYREGNVLALYKGLEIDALSGGNASTSGRNGA